MRVPPNFHVYNPGVDPVLACVVCTYPAPGSR